MDIAGNDPEGYDHQAKSSRSETRALGLLQLDDCLTLLIFQLLDSVTLVQLERVVRQYSHSQSNLPQQAAQQICREHGWQCGFERRADESWTQILQLEERHRSVSVAVSAAEEHSCLQVHGQIWTAGSSGNAGHPRLGRSNLETMWTRARVGREDWLDGNHSGLGVEAKAIQVSAGSEHLLVLLDDGCAFSCGDGTSGALGHGSDDSVGTLRQMRIIDRNDSSDNARIRCLAAGKNHTLLATAEGQVYSCGAAGAGRLGQQDGDRSTGLCFHLERVDALAAVFVVRVAAGQLHSAALSATGELWTWGASSFGRLGHAEVTEAACPPRRVTVSDGGGQRVVDVACGNEHTAAVTADGSLFCWGSGAFGKLGHFPGQLSKNASKAQPAGLCDPQHPNVPTPARVHVFLGASRRRLPKVPAMKAVSCGGLHTAALSRSGQVFTFGAGHFGQTGHGHLANSDAPTLVEGLGQHVVAAVSCGLYHTIAVTTSHAAYTWGRNNSSQLGLGRVGMMVNRPRLAPALSDA
jgi:alpha-tubulin suppressor-like RCC1 family protein